jgi:hypothetical protein
MAEFPHACLPPKNEHGRFYHILGASPIGFCGQPLCTHSRAKRKYLTVRKMRSNEDLVRIPRREMNGAR